MFLFLLFALSLSTCNASLEALNIRSQNQLCNFFSKPSCITSWNTLLQKHPNICEAFGIFMSFSYL